MLRAQYELFTKFEKCLTLPLLVLTLLTGFLSALQSGLGANVGKAISTVVAISGSLSALVHTLNQNFAFAARAEKSLNLSKSYQNVVSKIEAELNMMKSEVAASGGGGSSPMGGLSLPEGMSGMLKIPDFGGAFGGGGAEAAKPAAAPSSSSGSAPGPTTATKAKFLQMIMAEIATLNGGIDDMPAALAATAETAVGLAAVTSCFGCFKRHAPATPASKLASLAGDLPGPLGAIGGETASLLGGGAEPTPSSTPRSARARGSEQAKPKGKDNRRSGERGEAPQSAASKDRSRLEDVL